jgi:hypothetical protein
MKFFKVLLNADYVIAFTVCFILIQKPVYASDIDYQDVVILESGLCITKFANEYYAIPVLTNNSDRPIKIYIGPSGLQGGERAASYRVYVRGKKIKPLKNFMHIRPESPGEYVIPSGERYIGFFNLSKAFNLTEVKTTELSVGFRYSGIIDNNIYHLGVFEVNQTQFTKTCSFD